MRNAVAYQTSILDTDRMNTYYILIVEKFGLKFLVAIISICVAGVSTGGSANILSAEEVMRKVDNRYDGDSSIAHSTLILIDKKGRERIRQIKIYSKDYDKDTKNLSLINSPPDISGTAYLYFDYEDSDKDDDSWLFLPSMQKIKRVAASDKSESFFGSDFTYSDINGLNLDWYSFRFIKQSEFVDGHDTWVIELTPKKAYKSIAEIETGYTKHVFWVRKDNFFIIKGKLFLKRQAKIKYFKATDLQKIDGVWVAKKQQMVTTKNNKKRSASVIVINSVTYNNSLADEIFNPETLHRGNR